MFANTDAKFNGVDLTAGARINANWRLEAIASTVDGDRDDISDSLHRIAPTNARISLFYETNNFSAKIEQVLMGEQGDISRTNTFDPTNGNNSYAKTNSYNLTNVFLTWVVSDDMTISAGAENLIDEDYTDHLTGFNRVLNSEVPRGSRMFGPGRNFFGRLQYQW